MVVVRNPIVAVVDSARNARDSYGALVYVELGLTVGSSVDELLLALNKRVPDLIVVGNDQAELAGELGAVAALDSLFPGVPLIAIGRHRPRWEPTQSSTTRSTL